MEIKIHALDFSASEELNNLAIEKIEKLLDFCNKIEAATVWFKIDRTEKMENQVCEIRLTLPGSILFVRRNSELFEKSISQALEALELQLKKK